MLFFLFQILSPTCLLHKLMFLHFLTKSCSWLNFLERQHRWCWPCCSTSTMSPQCFCWQHFTILVGVGASHWSSEGYRLYTYVTFTHHLSPCSSMVRASHWSSEGYKLYTYVTFAHHLSPCNSMVRTSRILYVQLHTIWHVAFHHFPPTGHYVTLFTKGTDLAGSNQNKQWWIEFLYRYKRAETSRMKVLNIRKLYLYFVYYKLYAYFQ